MVDIIPESQTVIGHGAFSVVYRAKLKAVSPTFLLIGTKSPHYYRRFSQSAQTKLYTQKENIFWLLDLSRGIFSSVSFKSL